MLYLAGQNRQVMSSALPHLSSLSGSYSPGPHTQKGVNSSLIKCYTAQDYLTFTKNSKKLNNLCTPQLAQ